MDDDRRTTRGGRLLAVAGLAIVTGATALAFSRVFAGDTAVRLVIAAWFALAVGVLLERRNLVVATLAAVAALALSIAWLVFPDTLRLGLPTMETLRRAGNALGQVGPQAQRQVSPTAPIAPLLLASVTAVFAAAFSAHALATRAASPALALAPSVALIAFADAALRGEGSLPSVLLFLVGALTVLLADGLRRIREWGPLRSRGDRSGRTTGFVLARGAGGVAALAIAVAVFTPGILPGYGADGLVDVRSNTGENGNLDPLVSIGDSLTRKEPVDLFRVESAEPMYWRLLALDAFDGTTWHTDDLQAFGEPDFVSGSALPVVAPEGASIVEPAFTVLSDLSFTWVPAPYPATSIDLGGPSFRFDPELGTIVAPEPLREGSVYRASSFVPSPTPDELDAVGPGDPALRRLYTLLPDGIPNVVDRLAHEWTAQADTDYERAFAIQEQLRSPVAGFRYDDGYEPPEDADPLEDFLVRTRRGFCQQFAGTMAVMLRTLGVPARVAVGFTTGIAQDVGIYTVSTENAHAWVEVYFDGYGWLPFEPTPSRSNLAATSYLQPGVTPACTGPNCDTGPQGRDRGVRGTGSDTGAAGVARERADRTAIDPARLPVPATTADWRRSVGPALAILIALGAVVALAVPPVKAIARRGRLRRAKDPRSLVLATFDVFAARAGDLGVERREHETLSEFAGKIRRSSTVRAVPHLAEGSHDTPVGVLTDLAQRAAYAPPGTIGDADARRAGESARSALRALRRARGRVRNLAHVWRRGL